MLASLWTNIKHSGGNINWYNHFGKQFKTNINIHESYDYKFTLDTYREKYLYVQKETFRRLFIAAL